MSNCDVSHRIQSTALLLSLLLLCGVAPSAWAFDYFILLQDIPGESIDRDHENWIDATALSQSLLNASNRVAFSEIWFSKALDKSSPDLCLRAANGTRIPRAVVEFVQDSTPRVRFYQLVLSNSLVSSVQLSGDTGQQAKPQEKIGLSFAWLSWTYTEIDASGNPGRDFAGSWDLVRNTVGDHFRVTGIRQGSNILVSWPGQAGKTYQIMGSSIVSGPYSPVKTVTPTATATITEPFPIASGNFFYSIKMQ